MLSPTGLIPWFSKLREILTLLCCITLSSSREKPTHAQEVAPLFRSSLLACFLCARLLVWFVSIVSETGEVVIEKDSSNDGGNFDAFDNTHEEPTILHTKKFCIGSGNILLEKGVIQDFFTCAGALPTMGGSILHKTSSLEDAISLLVVELERQFIHMHPCIQRIFF